MSSQWEEHENYEVFEHGFPALCGGQGQGPCQPCSPWVSCKVPLGESIKQEGEMLALLGQ